MSANRPNPLHEIAITILAPSLVLMVPAGTLGIPALGWLGLASSIGGLMLVHVVAGIPSTTLFFRNYYTAVPRELVNAARIDGAGFWRIFLRIWVADI